MARCLILERQSATKAREIFFPATPYSDERHNQKPTKRERRCKTPNRGGAFGFDSRGRGNDSFLLPKRRKGAFDRKRRGCGWRPAYRGGTCRGSRSEAETPRACRDCAYDEFIYYYRSRKRSGI